MKKLFLVGESLPTRLPAVVGVRRTLSALDSRHGVFPNLVMKPLLSTLWALRNQGLDDNEFWTEITEILADDSQQRLNAFRKHTTGPKDRNPEFEILDDTAARLERLDPEVETWATFGFQTTFGLIRWMLRAERRVSKKTIQTFAVEFLSYAFEVRSDNIILPAGVPKKGCAQEGVIHRLFTEENSCGDGAEAMLRHAVSKYVSEPAKVAETLLRIRAFVPLLHNEAYQNTPYGIGQANFVLADDYDVNGSVHPGEMYWRVMGKALMRRLRPAATLSP
jgi:hypothetical protein